MSKSRGLTALTVIAAIAIFAALIWPTATLRLMAGILWGAVIVVGVWDE